MSLAPAPVPSALPSVPPLPRAATAAPALADVSSAAPAAAPDGLLALEPRQPSALQAHILASLSAAVTELRALDAQLADERARVEAAILALREDGHTQPYRPRIRSWEKSERQRALEEGRRVVKGRLRDCLTMLCERRIYSVKQLEAIVGEDGSPALFNDMQQAIGRADVFDALAGCSNPKARQAFLLRHKFGYSNDHIRAELHLRAASDEEESFDYVNWLCNRALDHAHLILNRPIVNRVRAEYFQFILDHNLSFPEYAEMRGR